jgi:8-oxo-dGTP pyrophosphatase MutT (NUDIX family)
VRLPIPVCRIVYRIAYVGLRIWWFVRRPHSAGVKCLFTQRDRVLLVRHTYGRREWNLPGGTVRRGEPPAATASREMHEELGVTVTTWRDMGRLAVTIDYRRDTMHLFHAELDGEPITVNPCEISAARWFSRGELPPDRSDFVDRILGYAAGGRDSGAPRRVPPGSRR